MTNYMFALGYTALTAELKVHFSLPVLIGTPATVHAWAGDCTPRL